VQANHMTNLKDSPLAQALAEQLGIKISKKYKLSVDQAVSHILDLWQNSPDCQSIIKSQPTLKQVLRTSQYKKLERDTTRKIYYSLRQYAGDQDTQSLQTRFKYLINHEPNNLIAINELKAQLAMNHVSTAERWPHQQVFWQTIKDLWGEPQSVLDVGSGILPIMFPWHTMGQAIQQYCAIDRSQESIDTLKLLNTQSDPAQGNQKLIPLQWSIEDDWQALNLPVAMFDVALILKVIPVVARQEPDSLKILANCPADRLIVTGCQTSMVKRQSIAKRERAVLLKFADEYNFKVLQEFATNDEVGFLLER